MTPFPNLPPPQFVDLGLAFSIVPVFTKVPGILDKDATVKSGKKGRICPPSFVKNFVTLRSCLHREFHNILIINLLHEMFLAFVHTNILMREYFIHNESEHSTLNLYIYVASS